MITHSRLGFDQYWAAYNFNHTYHTAPYFRNTPHREIHKQYEPDSEKQLAIDYMRARRAGETVRAVPLLGVRRTTT